MDNKDNLKEILKNLSEEELESLGKLLSQSSKKNNKRRRGRGKRKNKTTPTPKKESPDFMKDIGLSADEVYEMEVASKFDKERGLDKPKEKSILPTAPQFKKISVTCMTCNQHFEVATALLPPEKNRFRCNTSSCPMKRRRDG